VTGEGLQHFGPLLLVLIPLLGSAVLALGTLVPALRLEVRAQRTVVLASVLSALAVALALTPSVLAHGFVEVVVPALLGELRLRLDGVGALLTLLASFIWTCSTLHASAYFHDEAPRRALRYHITSLVALTAILTVLSAGDLVTLYLGFEWLGLIAYLFVIHTGTKAAEAAGLKYLVLTVLGGFAVLAGVLLVHALGGGDLASPLAIAAGEARTRDLAALFLLLGFGLKAGGIGLHSWLPDAHGSAPAPASAVLSGMMIKAGAYGIIRTIDVLYRGETEQLIAAAATAEGLGLFVLWWGVATMFIGVVMALWQLDAKRLLAYSSVSQMGFILAGVGAATYLADGGAIGWTGTLLHIVNHGLFKALLFLGIGAVVAATGTVDLRRLGGLARAMPWTFALTAIGFAGIVGVPLLNGFVSKSIIHHALEYAMAHAETGGHAHGLAWAERLYLLTTVGTAAALTKLLTFVFLGRSRGRPAGAATAHGPPTGVAPRGLGGHASGGAAHGGAAHGGAGPPREAPLLMRLAMAPLALLVVALGIRPQLVAPFLANALEGWGLPSGGVERYLTSPIGHPGDLRAALLALLFGVSVHLIASRTGLYARPLPSWLSLDWAVAGAARRGRGLVQALHVTTERRSDRPLVWPWPWRRPSQGSGADSWFTQRRRAIAAFVSQRTARLWEPPATRRPQGALGARLAPLSRRAAGLRRALGAWLVTVSGWASGSVRALVGLRAWAGQRWLAMRRATVTLGQTLDASWRVAREAGEIDEAERERLVLVARARIQRESRDVSLSMTLLVILWLVILGTLTLSGGA
jgi:formate hydrogenlyase subunit 3/multisubunit Na+/H+ antiporter MnhD subunit